MEIHLIKSQKLNSNTDFQGLDHKWSSLENLFGIQSLSSVLNIYDLKTLTKFYSKL
jgi:hypothetical protein